MPSEQLQKAYPVRTANIGALCITSAASSAIVQIGDRGVTTARLRSLSVQRQEDHRTAGDVYFESYRIFSRPLPALYDPDYDHGQVIQLNRIHACPNITVGNIRVIAAGSAASIQAGNGMRIISDSRIKHIRQYPRPKPIPPVGC